MNPQHAGMLVDVCAIFDSEKDRLKSILKTANELCDGQTVYPGNSFEPIPLYNVLAEEGFEHVGPNKNGTWRVYFYGNMQVG